MKCPECIKESKKSSVIFTGSSSTLIGGNFSYWDEEGNYHCHDVNTITSFYSCSEGHKWIEKEKNKCPDPGCDWNYEWNY